MVGLKEAEACLGWPVLEVLIVATGTRFRIDLIDGFSFQRSLHQANQIETIKELSFTRLDQARHGMTRQDKTRQDQTRPDKTGPDQTRPDQTRPDQTRPDKTRQGKARQDKIRQEKTRQDMPT